MNGPRERLKGQRIFKFEVMWIGDLERIVEEAWTKGNSDSYLKEIMVMSKRCANSLWAWNKNQFVNVQV